MQAGEEENTAAMEMHLVWNTHSSNWAGEQKAAQGMGTQHTAQEEQGLKEAGMCTQGTDGRDSYIQ